MLRRHPIFFLSLLALGCIALMNPATAENLAYPDTKKSLQTDDYHGTQVADPYRWLEDDVRES